MVIQYLLQPSGGRDQVCPAHNLSEETSQVIPFLSCL